MDDGSTGVFGAQLIWRSVLVLASVVVLVIAFAQWSAIDGQTTSVMHQMLAMRFLQVAGSGWLTIVLATLLAFES